MTKREQELAFHFFQVQSPVKSAPLLVLDLGLDVVDGVGRLHLKGDSLPRKGLDEDLHLLGEGGGERAVFCYGDQRTYNCWR